MNEAPAPTPDPRSWETIDQILRQMDREVWIVTAGDRRRHGGLLATWVSQISLDPRRPRVLAGIGPNHFTAELIERAGRFAVHLLRPDQAALGLHFALTSGRDHDKLADCGSAWHHSAHGTPLLDDCLSRLECQLQSSYKTPDRNFYWARVEAGAKLSEGMPLREQQLLAEATDQQRRQLKEDRQRDATLEV